MLASCIDVTIHNYQLARNLNYNCIYHTNILYKQLIYGHKKDNYPL
jgi:hypothetical protein